MVITTVVVELHQYLISSCCASYQPPYHIYYVVLGFYYEDYMVMIQYCRIYAVS